MRNYIRNFWLEYFWKVYQRIREGWLYRLDSDLIPRLLEIFEKQKIFVIILSGASLRWFWIWSQNFIFVYAFERKTRFKKFAWTDVKFFYCFEFAEKFQFEINPFVMKLKITCSRIADVLQIEFSRTCRIHGYFFHENWIPVTFKVKHDTKKVL